jgi:hypothetical protein
MAQKKVAVPPSGIFHAVRFYEDAASLANMVAGFVAEGLISEQPAIIIATPEHDKSIRAKLVEMSFDLDRLTAQNNLRILDAHETLAKFMVDGMPSPSRFEDTMLPIIDNICGNRTDCVIRAYGEMVDVLWKEGKESAAIRLEMLWNQLANTRKFSLLCGYSMGSFYKDAAFEDICHQHTHMVSAEGATAKVPLSTAVVTQVH